MNREVGGLPTNGRVRVDERVGLYASTDIAISDGAVMLPRLTSYESFNSHKRTTGSLEQVQIASDFSAGGMPVPYAGRIRELATN